jgi:uracil phosphoribosyltransferase
LVGFILVRIITVCLSEIYNCVIMIVRNGLKLIREMILCVSEIKSGVILIVRNGMI